MGNQVIKSIIPAFVLFNFLNPFISVPQSVTSFNGGNLKIKFSISSNLLYGFQSTSGGSISSQFNKNVGGIFWNPGALALNLRPQVSIDYAPPVFFGYGTYQYLSDAFSDQPVQVEDRIRENIDAQLPLAKYQPGVSPVYPGVDVTDQSPGGIKSLALITAPYHGYVFGFSYFSPLEVHANIFGSGMAFGILDDSSSFADINFIITSIGMNTSLDFGMSTYSFAVAKSFNGPFSAGITLDRNFVTTKIRGNYVMDGLIYVTQGGTSGGSTASYNDPNVPGNDNLNSEIHSNFHGSNINVKIGANFKPSGSRFSGDAVLILPSKIRSSGSLDMLERLPPFLDLGSDTLFDINDYEFDTPTRTKTVWTHGDKLDFNFPGSFALGTTYQTRFLTSSFTMTFFFNEASFRYQATVIDSEEVQKNPNYRPSHNHIYKGVKPKTGFNFAFQFPFLTIGLGMISVDLIDEGKKTATTLPRISMGTGMSLGKTLRVDGLFLAETNPFMRVSMTYYLDKP